MTFLHRIGATVLAGAIGLSVACSAGTAAITNDTSASRQYLPPIPAGQSVTIVFENYNLASAGIGRDATLQMIKEFMELHPNIKVETKGTDSTQITASIRAQLAAGNPPDIAQLLLREWDLVIDIIAPVVLEDIIAPNEIAQHLGGEHAMHPNAMKLVRRERKTHGMPYVFSTPTLFYNADLFRQAGLDPNRPPKTWEEVKQYGLQIKERTGKSGIHITCVENDWCAQALHLSNGGRVLSEDRKTVQFGEPLSIEAMRMWQDLVKSGVHSPLTDRDGSDAFAAGNVGMFLQTSAVQAGLLASSKDKWELRAAGMPGFGSKQVRPTNSGSGLGILARDPLKQRAAWELVKFLTSERAFTIITEKIGYLPLRTSIINDPRYLKDWVAKNPQILPNLEQLGGLEPSVSYPGENHVQIRDIYLKAQQQVLYQGADVERTMREAQSRAQELMPRR